jgi:hypothetical protein
MHNTTSKRGYEVKPFDLEAAKAGKPLITRNGQRARFVAYVPEAREDFRVIAHVHTDNSSTLYHECGLYMRGEESPDDLFMAPETRTVYANIFRGGTCDWYDTEEEARAGLNARALKIAVPVTFDV